MNVAPRSAAVAVATMAKEAWRPGKSASNARGGAVDLRGSLPVEVHVEDPERSRRKRSLRGILVRRSPSADGTKEDHSQAGIRF